MVSPTAKPLTVAIQQPRILLVEGPDDQAFFNNLIEKKQTPPLQIIQYSEQNKLGVFLRDVLTKSDQFSELVEVLGIVKDADTTYQSAFQSIQDSLRVANLPVPDAPLEVAEPSGDGIPKVVAYVMPDNNSKGDLENLCLEAVRDHPALACVDQYFNCLHSKGYVPRQESKARLRVFLSANPDNPNLLIGQAIAAGVLPWDSPAFEDVHKFLDFLDAA